jgi:flagellar biosynthesis component FlhA
VSLLIAEKSACICTHLKLCIILPTSVFNVNTCNIFTYRYFIEKKKPTQKQKKKKSKKKKKEKRGKKKKTEIKKNTRKQTKTTSSKEKIDKIKIK